MYTLRISHTTFISASAHVLLVVFIAKAINTIEKKETFGQYPSVFLKVTKVVLKIYK